MSISSPGFARLHRRAQEVRDRDARDLDRILEREEDAGARALVDLHFQQVLALEEDLAVGHLVGRMAGQYLGERALAGAVGPMIA